MLTTTAETTVVRHPNGVENDDDDDGGYFSTAPSSPPLPTTMTSATTANFFFYSAPTSPMHYVLSSAPSRSSLSPATYDAVSGGGGGGGGSFEFEFSSRVGSPAAVTSADELFLNGQIRPMKLSAHLSRPHLNEDDDDDHDDDDDDVGEGKVRSSRDLRLRNRSQRRRTRSMSPLRSTTPFDWITPNSDAFPPETPPEKAETDAAMTSATSASSSRCSSAGRSSKRWLFLKDFLRSKSEGRSNNKFWHNINISFSSSPSSSKEKKTTAAPPSAAKKTAAAAKRRSAHEMHYAANRAQAEEMRKKTYLPYRQGLLGCLGFNSKSYGALHGFASALNPVSSRFELDRTTAFLKNGKILFHEF